MTLGLQGAVGLFTKSDRPVEELVPEPVSDQIHEKDIDVEGAPMSIPHRTVGHGPKTVFLLHGWPGPPTAGELPRLPRPRGRDRVFTDNRGYGARMDEAGEFTLDEVAEGRPGPGR